LSIDYENASLTKKLIPTTTTITIKIVKDISIMPILVL